MQFQCQPIALATKRYLSGHSGAQRDHRIPRSNALCEGLGSVLHHIEQRLNELRAVATEFGDGGVVVALHLEALRILDEHQRAHALTHLMDIDVSHQMRMAVGRQEPVYQALQAVGLMDDDLGVFGELAAFQLHLQQLRRTADAAQGIFDFVGQVANQFLVGLGLVAQALFAILAGVLFQGP